MHVEFQRLSLSAKSEDSYDIYLKVLEKDW